MDEYYITTQETLREETNDEGETTYFIKGQISKGGKPFKDCIFIWDGNMSGNESVKITTKVRGKHGKKNTNISKK